MAGRDLDIVVMAAGMGTRMRSNRPKVLHRLAGTSLLQHVLATAAALGPRRIVVVTGFEAESVEAVVRATGAPNVTCVRQEPQLGTGHAVQQAVPQLADDGFVLILNGDVPLIEAATVRALVEAAMQAQALALLTIELDEPGGYGRVRRVRGRIAGIVEERDASPAERAIREVYTGVMAAPAAALKRWLAGLRADNAQGEYYLTDVVAAAVIDGVRVVAAPAREALQVLGVNSPAQLAALERALQRRSAERFMDAGVRLADPARFDLRGTLECGRDVEIDVGCVFDGRVVLGDDVSIGAYCMLKDVVVEAGARIAPCTHVDGGASGARIGRRATVGPFARLRAGTELGADVHVGNFVEIKNSTLGAGAKANHLAYLGDATVGERVNYGAGSITANYDGANKHRTLIGADAHIGSNCVLVAPVTVGEGATIGGGSTIAKDAPAGQLTVARARQASLPGWKRPTKQR
jgi:bifunctional UDP-N-acetylglucosamine pyrophosphorylase/glucosamine-1-phosphate N-acetyltransferase